MSNISACSDAQLHIPAETQHAFTLKDHDWGYDRFVHQQSLAALEGFVVNDTLIFEVHIRLNPSEREETGHMGLRGKGANRYMNSLLQTLFHLNHFRKVRPVHLSAISQLLGACGPSSRLHHACLTRFVSQHLVTSRLW